MNLYMGPAKRTEEGLPVRVGLVGSGTFGARFEAPARRETETTFAGGDAR